MRLARVSVLTALVVVAPLTWLTPASAEPTPPPSDPLGQLINPKPIDPVIEALPAVPVPHAPYTGSVCPDGAPSCIDVTIAEMQRRLDLLAAACDHDAVFSLAYLRVTEDVREAVNSGVFQDRVWLAQVDALFAQDYFDALDAWSSGDPAQRASVPKAWRIALDAADEKAVSGLGNFMLAMNAHINRDFSYVLAEVGLTDADGKSHKQDHNAYNQRLDQLYAPVFAEEAARFDPTFDDIDVLTVEETGAGAVIRGWREIVWRNAENLALAKTPLQRRLAEQVIEDYAAGQARFYRNMFAVGPEAAAARDAWCAQHGTGG